MGKIFTFLTRTLLDFIILPMGILVFNLFLILPWFSGSGPANLGSIEVSYVSMAKFLVSNFPYLSWAPFWYLGFPFHVFYTPILPFLTALLHVLDKVSLWQAYRIVSGIGFILTPVSLFFFVLALTRNRWAGMTSGIFYSVAPTIFNFILPSGEVRADSFNSGFYEVRRLVNLVRWGEGPHNFSLVFLPLAGLFFFKALEKRRPSDIILAAVFVALTALTNAVGLYALILLLLAFFLVQIFFEDKRREEGVFTAIFTAIFTYGLIAFWYNRLFISTFFSEGGGAWQNWLNMLPWGIIFLAGVVFLFLFILKKLVKDKAFSAVFLWTGALFGIVATYYLSAPPQLWQERIELAPQALRYIQEVDMGLAALVGIFIAQLCRKISHKLVGGVIGFSLSAAISLAFLAYGFSSVPALWKAVGGTIALEKTAEKKMADFLATKVDSQKGERVFLAGNYAFYLNYFSDVWQLRGGLYQAKTHPWPEHIYYQLRVGKDPEIAQAWLEIINAKYLVVIPGGEYEQKGKFGIFPLLTTMEDGSLIYTVPLTNASPVKVVDLTPMGGLRSPQKGDDKEPILAYDAWLKEIPGQTATFQKINNDFYQIRAKIGVGEGILVQMTADSGWRTKSPQGKVAIKKDPLGFFVLVPERTGEWEITLTHGKTWDIWLGYLITLVTLGAAVYFLVRDNFSKGVVT